MVLNLAQVESQSVQDLPQVDKKSGLSDTASFWAWETVRGSVLPAWGTRQRERILRLYDRNEYNNLWLGASAGLIKKIKATSYELKGGRNLTNRFDGVLRNAQFGAGWGVFLSLFLRDYLRFDGGAWAEIIAPGNSLKAPTGAVTGIAHLDSFRCLPTGDPEYPVVYYSRKGGIHVLHHTRVLHLIDQPDGDQDHPGYGLCALSRAIAVAERQVYISRYIAAKLDDKPEPGVFIANNVSVQDRDKVYARFRGERDADLPPEWGRVVWFFSLDPARKAEINSVSFSNPPDKFDYPTYVNVDVNELALAIGIDKQELWELSGATGTAGQSVIQAEKSEGKAPGEIRASLEREINNKLLPESLEFQWKVKDGRASQQEAQTAQVWAGVATTLAPIIGNQLAAEILANQVEAVADVLFDENGQTIRLPDADKKPADQTDEPITAQDNAPNGTQNTTTAQDNTPNATKGLETDAQRRWFFAHLNDGDMGNPLVPIYDGNGNIVERRRLRDIQREIAAQPKPSGAIRRISDFSDPELVRQAHTDELEQGYRFASLSDNSIPKKLNRQILTTLRTELHRRGVSVPRVTEKSYDDTRAQFVTNLVDLFHAGNSGDTTRRRSGVVMRAQLSKLGRQAYEDGLKQGGVMDGMDDDDRATFAVWLANQSQYVTNFLDELYSSGLTDKEVEARAEAWANVSLQGAYYDGVSSADKNGMYAFIGTDGMESCDQCKALKDQVHRMKDWTRKQLRPGVDIASFDCHGFQCQHRLDKTTGKASGNWLSAIKGLETDEQRRWFFAHLNAGDVDQRSA